MIKSPVVGDYNHSTDVYRAKLWKARGLVIIKVFRGENARPGSAWDGGCIPIYLK